jgi:ABC-2 type transport system ATP-binding protein
VRYNCYEEERIIIMEVIRVKNFTKDYGFNRGVFDANFDIYKGEVYGFLGPNGAGKTTTIRHLMGFSKPDSGSTQIMGLDSFEHRSKILKSVGYIPGELALPSGLTGFEFISMMKKMRNINDDSRINHLIQLFELDASGDTKRMSFGNKRKLAIIVAFMHDPEILILDEPTSGLDPVMQEKFIEFIKNEKARGKTILLSSHIFSEVEALCDRVSIIKHGHIVDEFPMSKLKHNENKTYVFRFENKTDAKDAFDKLSKSTQYQVESIEECQLKVNVHDTNINRLLSDLEGLKVIDFEYNRLTLESYFMTYYHDEIKFGGIQK